MVIHTLYIKIISTAQLLFSCDMLGKNDEWANIEEDGMKILGYGAALVVILSAAYADITAREAHQYMHATQTVCGDVKQVTVTNKAVFINFDAAYPNQSFYGVVWQRDVDAAGGVYALRALHGKNVCITGQLQLYKQIPNIHIDDGAQIEVRKKR